MGGNRGLVPLVGLLVREGFGQRGGQSRTVHQLCRRRRCRVQQAAQYRRIPELFVQPVQRDAKVAAAGRQLGPSFLRAASRKPGAGEVQRRERPIPTRVGPGPSGEGKRERGQLHATRVQLQPVQILPQHRVHRFAGGEALPVHPHGNQHGECGDEEVPGAAAGIDDSQLPEVLRPSGERTGGVPTCPLLPTDDLRLPRQSSAT